MAEARWPNTSRGATGATKCRISLGVTRAIGRGTDVT